MDSIEVLVYCPPMEEVNEDVTGWNKETIAYVSEHKSQVYAKIRGIAKNMRNSNLQTTEVEDIYSGLMMYLYKCDDYNIEKAFERSSTDIPVTLEGYLNVCIKCCVVRHCTSVYSDEMSRIQDIISDDEGKEMSILDNIADERSEEQIDSILYDLDAICRSCETMRYKYGPDVYLIWFIRLLTLNKQDSDLYKNILNILGIYKKDLGNVEKNSPEDELMTTFAKAIDVTGIEDAIKVIRNYVYSAQKIEDTVVMYS